MSDKILVTKRIRGLELDTYKKARMQAISEGKNIGALINEAIKFYLIFLISKKQFTVSYDEGLTTTQQGGMM